MSIVTTILSEGAAIDSLYEVVSIDVRREVNRIPSATLVLFDGNAAAGTFALSGKAYFEPGKAVAVLIRYESETEDATLFEGVVVRHAVEAHPHASVLRVDLKNAAVKLAQARKSRVFRGQTDAAVIRTLVEDAGLTAGTIDATQPEHAELVQYNCTDWDFLLSRAESQGLLAVAGDAGVSARKADVSGPSVRTFEYGLSEIFDVEFEADAVHQYSTVKSSGWSIDQQERVESSDAKAFALAQGNLDGQKLAEAVGFGAYALFHPVPVPREELQAWADARLQRSRLALLRGRLATPGHADVALLDLVTIAGLGDRFNGKALVTGICDRVDAVGWRTDLQFGLSPRIFAAEEDIRDAPAAGLLPAVSGLHIGVVADFAEDPDNQLRVKVTLPGIESAPDAVWARLAVPDAGKDRGFFFRPESGDEVVVGFFNDDPRQPVILGSLYSSKNAPKDPFASLSDKNVSKGLMTRGGTKIVFTDDSKAAVVVETAGQNRIVLDDDKERIVIADQHGNTITMDKDGITLASAKDLKIDAKGDVVITGTKVDVK
jgi:Rhs element Vgr protein